MSENTILMDLEIFKDLEGLEIWLRGASIIIDNPAHII